MSDPLEALLVSGAEVNRQLLAAILSHWVRIDRDTGEVIPSEGFERLRPRQRILVFLIASKAVAALNLRPSEGLSPTEVTTQSGMPSGTVKRELREMLAARLIAQDAEGRYFVPAFALERVKTVVGGGKGG